MNFIYTSLSKQIFLLTLLALLIPQRALFSEDNAEALTSSSPPHPDYTVSTEKKPGISASTPDLVILLIIDQFAWHTYEKHEKFLTGGLKLLRDAGTLYTHAFFPHARPATATGHAALATGATANQHGYIANDWSEQGNKIKPDTDSVYNAAVFNPEDTNKIYNYGRSARKLMSEGIADCFVSHDRNYKAYGVSLKSRAAIPLAGKRGMAIWLDEETGKFTTSKSYTSSLPNWLTKFNTKITWGNKTETDWVSLYPDTYPGYQFTHTSNYRHASHDFSLINRKQVLPKENSKKFDLLSKTPEANQLLLDCAHDIIRHDRPDDTHKLLLAVSMSSLDLVGHFYGPDSKEAIDMLYQIDRQIQNFIESIEKEHNPKQIAWILTSDHGIMPIPELLAERGLPEARRIDSDKLLESINTEISEKFQIPNFFINFNIPYFYSDPKYKDHRNYTEIITFSQKILQNKPGITSAWTAQELIKKPTEKFNFINWEVSDWFKTQYYPGRSGDVSVQVEPYIYLTDYSGGTSHVSPYQYDIHVPIFIKAPGRVFQETLHARTSPLAIPATIAHFMKFDPPRDALKQRLPGV